MTQGTYQRCKADGCRKKALRRLYSTEMCALHYEQWRATLFDKDQWVCCRCHRQASTKWDGNSYCGTCYKVALNEKYPKVEPQEPDPLTDYTKVQQSPEPNYYLKQLIREVITEELDKISAQKSDSQVDAIVEAIRSAMKGN